MATYDTIVVGGMLGEQGESREISRKLSRYVQGGGRLFITVDSLKSLGADGIALSLGGEGMPDIVRVDEAAGGGGGCTEHAAGTVVTMHEDDGGQQPSSITEPHSFTTCALSLPAGAVTLASIGSTVIAAEVPVPAPTASTGTGGVAAAALGSVVVLGAAGHGVS